MHCCLSSADSAKRSRSWSAMSALAGGSAAHVPAPAPITSFRCDGSSRSRGLFASSMELCSNLREPPKKCSDDRTRRSRLGVLRGTVPGSCRGTAPAPRREAAAQPAEERRDLGDALVDSLTALSLDLPPQVLLWRCCVTSEHARAQDLSGVALGLLGLHEAPGATV